MIPNRLLAIVGSILMLTACSSGPKAPPSDEVPPPSATQATAPAASPAPAAQRTLRVVTWNIHHGAGTDGRVELGRIAARLRELNPDVIFLQEVDRLTNRSGRIDQPTWLAHHLGMWSAFGAFMPYDGGEYGMCILSRWPVHDVRNVELPPGDLEPRISLAASLPLEQGVNIRLFNVHLDWLDDDSDRYAQAQALLNVVTADVAAMGNAPAIIGGDFNDGPGSRTVQLFRSNFTEAAKSQPTGGQGTTTATWPSHAPSSEIDFVFILPAGVLVAGPAESLEANGASDHRPVLTTVQVR